MKDRQNNQDRSGQVQIKNRINEAITVPQVRLISDRGEQLGVLITSEALKKAEEQGLDLVEVAPDANPPVCKILDFGKLRYREQKKAADARKKSTAQNYKELRLRPNTDPHDLDTKLKQAKRFLDDGDKVRFQMRFKGREAAYQDRAQEIIRFIKTTLEPITTIEEQTGLVANRIIIAFAPKAKTSSAKASSPKTE